MEEDFIKKAEAYKEQAANLAKASRLARPKMRLASLEQRNGVLLCLALTLEQEFTIKSIAEANKMDITKAKADGLTPSLIDRLEITPSRLKAMVQALRDIALLPDPLGDVLQGKTLANGIELIQKRVPLGVIFTIYESRPNVTVDVGALCIKSGNCAILRGGREAFNTNLILFNLFTKAMKENGLAEDAIQFVEEVDRAFMLALLWQEEWIDLLVPRGGEKLIKFISANSRIPVVKHDKGVCNLYIDDTAKKSHAIDLAINSKLQRASVCNAIENLIIHKNFAYTKELLESLREAGAKLFACSKSHKICPSLELIAKGNIDAEYSKEYLDESLSVKIVEDIDEALKFIFRYGSGHSEGIVSQRLENIKYFENNVDTAAVLVNCSTRFHDGGQMGFGAEIGISTGRLHARGPMTLTDLTTTTYTLSGNGQVRK